MNVCVLKNMEQDIKNFLLIKMILIILGNKKFNYQMDQRVDYAFKLYKSKKYTKIIPTGGVTHPNKYHSEAFYMKQRLIKKGIKPNKIHIENRALSTIENAKYTKKLVGGKKIVVVTSKNHYQRAKKIFDRIYGRNIKFFSS